MTDEKYLRLTAEHNAAKSALNAQMALVKELRVQEQKAARKLVAGLQKLVDNPDDIESHWVVIWPGDVEELLSIYHQETP